MNIQSITPHSSLLRKSLALLLLGGLLPLSVPAQNIVLTGGSADLNFFYNPSTDTFDTVFRQKGTTVASGLDTPYTPPAGIAGGGTDFRFDSFTVLLTSGAQVDVGGTSFYVSSRFDAPVPGPDLGIRTRFRDTGGNDLFSSFFLVLDWGNSIKPDGASFILFAPGSLGGVDVKYLSPGNLSFASDPGILASTWPVWGHTHWHWGFSELGDYTLAFNFFGIGPDGPSSVGSTEVNFTVIPEPAAVAFLIGLAASGLLLFRRRSAS